MVVTRIFSGLGNQMFQYAAGRQLAARNSASLWLDTSSFIKDTLRRYEMQGFNLRCNILQKQALPLPMRVRQYLRGSKPLFKAFTDTIWQLDEGLLKETSKDIRLSGYWAWPQYFEAIATELRSEFTLQVPLVKLAPHWVAIAQEAGSVAIHIRRGDYAHSAAGNQFFGTLDMQYYKTAIAYIQDRVPAAHFLIFSDDMAWVETEFLPAVQLKKFSLVIDTVLATPAQELVLMSYCRHQVMANSTFSWWGAWLNNNPGKICIQPARWYKDDAAQAAYEKGILHLPGSIKL